MSRRILALCTLTALLLASTVATGEPLRVATFNASLSRDGPGVLLLALQKRKNKQIKAVIEIIQTVRPDILLINEFDHDVDGLAKAEFIAWLAENSSDTKGIDYPHSFTAPPNTGYLSGEDLNGDGKTRGPNDAFGFGRFPGQYGMLLLSRHPIDAPNARSFARLRWKDFPDALLPTFSDGSPFPSDAAQSVMRLSSKSHWDVPVMVDGEALHIWASHPTPPVFDGPEDMNGRRNADEIRFWVEYLQGTEFTDDSEVSAPREDAPFVILGDLNSDPNDGDSRHEAIRALITHPMVQDPEPTSHGGAEASAVQRGANAVHKTDPSLDTADWRDKGGPGNLRVDYALPSADLSVTDAGVFWPTADDPLFRLIGKGKPVSSDHRLVWIDLDW
jgi:endonuclease/exonuclease/phosphatase family metal-dependent hydrolase